MKRERALQVVLVLVESECPAGMQGKFGRATDRIHGTGTSWHEWSDSPQLNRDS